MLNVFSVKRILNVVGENNAVSTYGGENWNLFWALLNISAALASSGGERRGSLHE